MKEKIGVLHLVDSLASGGAERVAVMLANNLPREHYRAYLCASRRVGPLQRHIESHVTFYDLRRKGLIDFKALLRLVGLTRQEHIHIVHAHTTSLFFGAALCWLNPSLSLVWHDHVGLQEMNSRPVFLYRPFAVRAQAVFAVTRKLADWAVCVLGIPENRVMYLPNFVEAQSLSSGYLDLPGQSGKRIVCVANIRSQKDHLTLVRAMAQVERVEPSSHLILVGAETNPKLANQVREETRRLGLERNLTWLGSRQDIPWILAHCDIGVLSSASEGFPVTLLEYGRAGLAAVATQVGECAEILDEGAAGILVPPSTPDSLASGLLRLLQSPDLRARLGERFRGRVKQNYSVETIMKQVCKVYERIL